jgi:hypothetical protein
VRGDPLATVNGAVTGSAAEPGLVHRPEQRRGSHVVVLGVRDRRPVRAGLFATFVVVLVGWAPLRGYGRDRVPDNPTVDPLDYATAIPTVLTVVWLFTLGWIAVAVRRGRVR